LRYQLTDAEMVLWQCLRNKRLSGFRFRNNNVLQNTEGVVIEIARVLEELSSE